MRGWTLVNQHWLLYSGTPFVGNEGNASGGGASACVTLANSPAILAPVLASVFALTPNHRWEAIFFARVGYPDRPKPRKPRLNWKKWTIIRFLIFKDLSWATIPVTSIKNIICVRV